MENSRTADWLSAALILIVLLALLLEGGDPAYRAGIFSFACGAAALVIIARGSAGLWAYVLPGLGIVQLLPIGADAVAVLRPAEVWLFAALADAGMAQPTALTSYRFETLRSVVELAGFASLLVVAANIESQKARRLVLGGIVCLGLWQVAEGAAQFLAGRLLDTESAALAHGSFVSRNHYAAFLEGCLGSAMALFGVAAPAVLVLGTLVAGVALSYSRAGITIAIFALICWFLAGQKRVWAATATLAVVVTVSAQYGYADRFLDVGNDLRPTLWRDAWTQVAESPWLGSGLGTFAYVFERGEFYLPRKSIEHAHNDYLEFAVELGLPVFVLLSVAAAEALRRSAATNRAVVFAVGLILLHAFVDSPLHSPAVGSLVAVLVGLAWQWKRTAIHPPAALIPAMLAVVGLMLAGGYFSSWDASRQLAGLQQALVAGDRRSARRHRAGRAAHCGRSTPGALHTTNGVGVGGVLPSQRQ